MGCPTHTALGNNLVFSVTTKSSGVATDADSVPTYRVYEDETATAILTGSMAKLDDASTTGLYSETINCTVANGFEVSKSYTIYIEAVIGGSTSSREFTFQIQGSAVTSVVTVTPTTGTTTGEIPILTFHGVLESLRDTDMGLNDDVNIRVAKRAVREAYENLLQRADWLYLLRELQVNVEVSTALELAYDHTGHGDGDRMVTVSSGSLPTNLQTNPSNYRLKVSSNIYTVDQYVDSDQFTLDSNNNPGEDLDAETDGTLYRVAYSLPDDFRAQFDIADPASYWYHAFTTPADFMAIERTGQWIGKPFQWTIARERTLGRPGGWVIMFGGYPNTAEKLHVWYKAAGRRPKLSGLETKATAGTISISGATVTGTSTSFSSDMEGGILDVGNDGTTVPTDDIGDTPPSEQHRIRSVTSSSVLVLYTNATTVNTYKYRISDIIDLAPHMHNALLRGCEYYYSIKNNSDKGSRMMRLSEYVDAVQDAMANDKIYLGERGPLNNTLWRTIDAGYDFGTEVTL